MASNLCYLHGEYIKTVGGDESHDAYVAVLKNLDTGEKVLKIIDSPETEVYVAKPQYRTNTRKRECADKRELDMYKTRVNQMAATLYNAINNPGRWRTPPGYVNLRKQMSSPFVYGADIDYGVHLKMRCKKANGGRTPMSYNVGKLDIETDVHNEKDIILITYIDGSGEAYVAISHRFFQFHTVDEVLAKWGSKRDKDGKFIHWTQEELKAYDEMMNKKYPDPAIRAQHELIEPSFHLKLNKKGREAYEKSDPIQLHIKIFDQEVDLIKWIFDRIHEHKPDFCTIWNMDYDLPFILNRLQFRGVNPADVICHPDVPKQYRICEYHKDPGKKDDHITDHWSWFHLTDYTRYIDAMCCYGRLRKAKPREPSYRLDAIGGKEIGSGKLQFGDDENHSTMQRFHQVEYTVYNIVDVLIMHVMEAKNSDVMNMCMLIGVSTLDVFSHQSLQLKNSFYEYLEQFNKVPASIGEPIPDPWDKYIVNSGGAVLSPDNATDIGVSALKELFDAIVRACRFVCDIDVSSMYPSFLVTLNVTKETKLATLLYIITAKTPLKKPVPISYETIDAIPEVAKGLVIYNNDKLKKEEREAAMKFMSDKVHDFCVEAIYSESNAVSVCSNHFGLPDYDGMDQWMAEHHKELVLA